MNEIVPSETPYLGCTYNKVNHSSGLTPADLCADSLGQSAALSQLLPEALAHVVVDVVGPQQLLEGLGGVPQVLGEDVAHPPTLPQPLAEVRQLSGLSLDQRVELTAERKNTSVKSYMTTNLRMLMFTFGLCLFVLLLMLPKILD